jgi:rubrerythrin
MSTHSKIIEYIQLEKKYAEELKNLAETIKHPVLRTLFLGIAQDSLKHSMMYEAILQLTSQIQPFIALEELKNIATIISKHIETELKMLEEARKLLSTSQDPRIKLLVAAIADDEAKHHALLLAIKENIAEEEALTEQVYWDLVWKDSPWHGTPGG